MRRLKYGLCGMVLALTMVTGCGNGSTDQGKEMQSAEGNQEKLRVVTTIFPEYDWVREIVGEDTDGVDLTLLLDNGVDLHSYQPTADDMVKIADCDLFIYVGGESDEWVEDALAEAVNQDMQVIDLLDVLGDVVKEEEIVEGMEAEHDHEDGEEEQDHEDGEQEHDHEDGEEEHGHEDGEIEYDEHVWLSVKNAQILVDQIADTMAEIAPAKAEQYRKNADAYISDLKALDEEYQSAVADAKRDTVLFGDRFPFRYLADDYGLDYYAAFVGCSAETEASFETIVFLANKVDELGLQTVLTIEGQDHSVAETIVKNTASKDQNIATMDSMQSTTSKDVQKGITYLSVMKKNLEVLAEALQ